MPFHYPLNHSKPIQPRHLHIEKDKVGSMRFNQLNGFDSVGSLRHHIHIPSRLKQVCKLVASQLFVVNNQCGNSHGDVEVLKPRRNPVYLSRLANKRGRLGSLRQPITFG